MGTVSAENSFRDLREVIDQTDLPWVSTSRFSPYLRPVLPTSAGVPSNVHPPAFFLPVGKPPLKTSQSKTDGYSKPPNPGEGTWIMNEWINDFSEVTETYFSGDSTHFRTKLAGILRAVRSIPIQDFFPVLRCG
jgi:hypothetical protein